MQELNSQQKIAAEHVEGPLLVLAGAGSGKTRVIIHRILHLIDLGVLPSDILAVTFTNKAANEMRHRIRSLKNANVLTCTFHSLGAKILRESIADLGYKPDFTIYDEEDSEKLLKTCLEQLNLQNNKGLLKEMKQEISNAKNKLQNPVSQSSDLFNQIYFLYQTKLKECNAVDFDDLLFLTVKLLQENNHTKVQYQNRWMFILIDEYQDTNFAQYTLSKILVEQHKNIFAVGDPDQSIYSWRGACYENILNFEKDFPGSKVVILNQNYRSTNTILKASNALISHNSNRYEKELWSGSSEGAKIGVFVAQNEKFEAQFIANRILKEITESTVSLNDIAIFYRTNAQSRIFEDALLSARLDYSIIGGLSFYARKEIKDLLAFLKLIISDTDLVSFLRTIHLPKRGFGPAILEKLISASQQKGIPILPFCQMIIDQPSSFKLNTKQLAGLKNYLQLIHHCRTLRPNVKLHVLIAELISKSNYLEYLKEDMETFQDRRENIDELIGKAAEWEEEQDHPTLQQFLEELSLRSSFEENPHIPSIKLMTLHNSKGLEFSLVFVAGLEEDLCPHINSKDDLESIEEERRLCYVGMTRAKKNLYLTCSTQRFMWGTFRPMRPSRFLKEIPAQYLQNLSLISPPIQHEMYSQDPEGFSIGDSVYHAQFGAGTIQKAYRSSFGLTYDVLFKDNPTSRTLVAKFAKLTPMTKSYNN